MNKAQTLLLVVSFFAGNSLMAMESKPTPQILIKRALTHISIAETKCVPYRGAEISATERNFNEYVCQLITKLSEKIYQISEEYPQIEPTLINQLRFAIAAKNNNKALTLIEQFAAIHKITSFIREDLQNAKDIQELLNSAAVQPTHKHSKEKYTVNHHGGVEKSNTNPFINRFDRKHS